jgi:hypothetical protein
MFTGPDAFSHFVEETTETAGWHFLQPGALPEIISISPV